MPLAEQLEIVRDISSSFYLHLEVADRPGVLAQIAEVLGRNEVSVRSVVQRGLGDDARLVMVMHEGPETRFFTALEEIATLDFLRAPAPRDPGDRRGICIAGCREPLIERYRDRLPLEPRDPVVTMNEGSTPLVEAP